MEHLRADSRTAHRPYSLRRPSLRARARRLAASDSGVEHSANSLNDRLDRERFLQERRARSECTVAGYGFIAMAGHEQYRQLRIYRAKRISQLAATHSRHYHVAHKHVDSSFSRSRDAQCLYAIRCHQNRVAKSLECALD